MQMNRNQLKYLAVAAMLIDHIAFNLLPNGTLREVMRFIGRLTNPIMAYFIAEGYIHTRSIKRYIQRLCVFTLISWMPFNLFVYGYWPCANLGVIFTLMLGLIAICVWDKSGMNVAEKMCVILLLCYLSRYGDWRYVNVILPLLFYIFRKDAPKKWLSYYVFMGLNMFRGALMGGLRMYQTGIYVFPLLMMCYNGESGSKSVFHKWFFFVFYPLHLLILWCMR